MLLDAINMAFIKVVNDQYLFKLLLGPHQTFGLHDASARGQKYFQVLGLGLESFFFFKSRSRPSKLDFIIS